MPDPNIPTRATASKIVVVLAFAALTTAAAGAGAATLLTGSSSPSAWLQTYQHAKECRQAGAQNDPSCSPAAAEAIIKLRIAAEIESKATSLVASRKTIPTRPVARPVAAPRFAAPIQVSRPSSDGTEGLDG